MSEIESSETGQETDKMEPETVSITSDARTVNNAANAVRHNYRVLAESEKAQMSSIKNVGADFLMLVDSCGSSRELSLAKTKIEEAVMWAVKHVTK